MNKAEELQKLKGELFKRLVSRGYFLAESDQPRLMNIAGNTLNLNELDGRVIRLAHWEIHRDRPQRLPSIERCVNYLIEAEIAKLQLDESPRDTFDRYVLVIGLDTVGVVLHDTGTFKEMK